MNIIWWITTIVSVFVVGLTALVFLYVEWRKKLHKEGILDIRHDGLTAKPGEPKTIFDVFRLVKEHRAKEK